MKPWPKQKTRLILFNIKLSIKAAKKAQDEYFSTRAKLDDAKAASHSIQARGKVYSQILKQKKTGAIKGICGRLGDLGTIEDTFDVAVTTACGSLDSIVVETVDAAQKCIEYLKKENCGRATFICLDKLRSFNMNPINTPENVPRLFDLLKPKEDRFAPAFYHALGDTLVAKNLEQANKVAYGATRYRVVTLQGQLIDKSGTMSGGGNKILKGGMSSKSEADSIDIDSLNLSFEKAESVLAETKQKHQTFERELDDSVQLKNMAQKTLSRLELELKSLEQEKTDAEKSLEIARFYLLI